MMYHIPAVLNAEQLAHFTAQLQQADWVDGRRRSAARRDRKNNQQIDTGTPLYDRLQAAVLQALNSHPLFFAAALPRTLSAPLFNRYQQGNLVFMLMVRYATMARPAGCVPISPPRCFCEPDSYEGGELVIEDTYGQHRVKLPAGDGALSLQQPALRHAGHARRAVASFYGFSRWCAMISNARCCLNWTATFRA